MGLKKYEHLSQIFVAEVLQNWASELVAILQETFDIF